MRASSTAFTCPARQYQVATEGGGGGGGSPIEFTLTGPDERARRRPRAEASRTHPRVSRARPTSRRVHKVRRAAAQHNESIARRANVLGDGAGGRGERRPHRDRRYVVSTRVRLENGLTDVRLELPASDAAAISPPSAELQIRAAKRHDRSRFRLSSVDFVVYQSTDENRTSSARPGRLASSGDVDPNSRYVALG